MNKTIPVSLSLLLFCTMMGFSEEPENGRVAYHLLVDSWMNAKIDSETLIQEIGILADSITNEDEKWVKLYWLARFALVRGQIYYETRDKKASLAELEISHNLIERSIAAHDYSDSWRIMSEASSLIMIQKGLFYIIRNFTKAQDQANKSLELDPSNARAHLIIAQFLTNAPRIAGGNKKKGIALLRRQSSRSDLIDEDMFLVLLTLSEALNRNKQAEEAVLAYQDALEIFPNYRGGPTVIIDLEEEYDL